MSLQFQYATFSSTVTSWSFAPNIEILCPRIRLVRKKLLYSSSFRSVNLLCHKSYVVSVEPVIVLLIPTSYSFILGPFHSATPTSRLNYFQITVIISLFPYVVLFISPIECYVLFLCAGSASPGWFDFLPPAPSSSPESS